MKGEHTKLRRQPTRALFRDRHGASGRVGRLTAVKLTEGRLTPDVFVRQPCDPPDSASHGARLGQAVSILLKR